MKYARQITPERSRIVDAEGNELPERDTQSPMLHILPELFLGEGVLSVCSAPRLSCEVSVLSPEGIAAVETIVVRQPLPNRRYLVGGTQSGRYGLFIPLPDVVPAEVVLRVSWRIIDREEAALICEEGGEDNVAVEHTLRLRLRPTSRGQVFTTDVSAWPQGPYDEAPCFRTPYSVLSVRDIPYARWATQKCEWGMDEDALTLDEQLDVPSVLLSDIWGLEEFSEEQLHEVQQSTRFDPNSPGSIAHRSNACVQIPPKVLVEAIEIAREVSYAKGGPFSGSMAAAERHPALLVVCDWWNANAPNPAFRCAGLCEINVRVRDDEEYQPGDYEAPSSPIRAWGGNPGIGARVGDVVLLTFVQGQKAATFSKNGCSLIDVAGDDHMTVGVSEEDLRSGEVDEGWHALEALHRFPERFPAAWAWLNSPDAGHAQIPDRTGESSGAHDVGHALIVGPTKSGKTTIWQTLRRQWGRSEPG